MCCECCRDDDSDDTEPRRSREWPKSISAAATTGVVCSDGRGERLELMKRGRRGDKPWPSAEVHASTQDRLPVLYKSHSPNPHTVIHLHVKASGQPPCDENTMATGSLMTRLAQFSLRMKAFAPAPALAQSQSQSQSTKQSLLAKQCRTVVDSEAPEQYTICLEPVSDSDPPLLRKDSSHLALR